MRKSVVLILILVVIGLAGLVVYYLATIKADEVSPSFQTASRTTTQTIYWGTVVYDKNNQPAANARIFIGNDGIDIGSDGRYLLVVGEGSIPIVRVVDSKGKTFLPIDSQPHWVDTDGVAHRIDWRVRPQ